MTQIKRMDADFFGIEDDKHRFAQIKIERQSVCIFYSQVSLSLKKLEHG